MYRNHRMKKTTIWLTHVEDEALTQLGLERARSRSHVNRMAIRREAGLDDETYLRILRGGWNPRRGAWIFSAQEELVMHLAHQDKTPGEIARELRLPEAGVLDVLEGIDRKMNAYGDAWDA